MAGSARLFVNNLPDNYTEDKLKTLFSEFGDIEKVDVKSKENEKIFAFITVSLSTFNIDSCIRNISSRDFNGNKLFVTRARESFLERLQRERDQAQQQVERKQNTSNEPILAKSIPKINLSESLNPRKRRIDTKAHVDGSVNGFHNNEEHKNNNWDKTKINSTAIKPDEKKLKSDKKRIESMLKKRQEFKQKQMTIKSALVGIDKIPNKKITFNNSDDEEVSENVKKLGNNKSLFEDDGDASDDNNINFNIKEQYEGKKGQKVLQLQNKYKSDSRFILDKRFVDDDAEDNDAEKDIEDSEVDEKTKQLNILQDVLGVAIKTTNSNNYSKDKKTKSKLGMLRFDPTQPEHSKFLAETIVDNDNTKSKKKKNKDKHVDETTKDAAVPEIEVSKERFYKVSDTLKETMAQSTGFSLRSLFKNTEDNEDKATEQDATYIPLDNKKESKTKHPLDHTDKNPFKYDSSESDEENEAKTKITEGKPERKIIWKEKFFFSKYDKRFKDGLAFINEVDDSDIFNDRRELKALMKKRIYNSERRDQMFKKKIGGRKQRSKKPFSNKIKRT